MCKIFKKKSTKFEYLTDNAKTRGEKCIKTETQKQYQKVKCFWVFDHGTFEVYLRSQTYLFKIRLSNFYSEGLFFFFFFPPLRLLLAPKTVNTIRSIVLQHMLHGHNRFYRLEEIPASGKLWQNLYILWGYIILSVTSWLQTFI